MEIAAHGDIVVKIEHDISGLPAARSFRVSTSTLKTNSKYFQNILQPGRFEEATRIEMAHKALRSHYGNMIQVPSAELPVLNITDVG